MLINGAYRRVLSPPVMPAEAGILPESKTPAFAGVTLIPGVLTTLRILAYATRMSENAGPSQRFNALSGAGGSLLKRGLVIAGVAAIAALGSPFVNNDAYAREVLIKNGAKDVLDTHYQVTGCLGQRYRPFARGFEAIDPAGNKVKGVVCTGVLPDSLIKPRILVDKPATAKPPKPGADW